MTILVCSPKFLKYLSSDQLDHYLAELDAVEAEEPGRSTEFAATRRLIEQAKADLATRARRQS